MTDAAFKTSLHARILMGAAAMTLALPAAAQDESGVLLRFGIAMRAETNDNSSLALVSAGRTSRASSTLSFGLISETPIALFTIDASGKLATANGPAPAASGFTDPSLAMSYERTVANSNLSFSASWREADLAADRAVDDFDVGGGSRQTLTFGAALNWGTAGPIGMGLNVGLTDVAYQNSPGNTDNQVRRVGLSARADLSDVLSLNTNLRGSRFTETGGVPRDTLGADLGLTLARPQGEMGLTLSYDKTEDGDRQSLRFRHSLEQPWGKLSYNIGISRDVTGDGHAVGGIDWQQDLANGNIGLSADRSVTADTADSETLQDRLTFDYGRDLSSLTSLGLSMSWARQENTLTGLSTTNTDLTARVTHNLVQNWMVEAGYTHRIRDEDGVGNATSDKVFLELRRSFEVRF